MYETGGMRRAHLRGREDILKRLLVQGATFNPSLIVRTTLGVGKTQQLQGLDFALFVLYTRLLTLLSAVLDERRGGFRSLGVAK